MSASKRRGVFVGRFGIDVDRTTWGCDNAPHVTRATFGACLCLGRVTFGVYWRKHRRP